MVMTKRQKKPSCLSCEDYQEGKCSKQNDHDIGLITHKHICAYCLYISVTIKRKQKRSEPTSTTVEVVASVHKLVDVVDNLIPKGSAELQLRKIGVILDQGIDNCNRN